MKSTTSISLRAALAIAGVYGFFLIFAQFSFVELLRQNGVGADGEKVVLGAMALAGMVGGFWAAWRGVSSRMAKLALAAAGITAGLATQASGLLTFGGLALGVGGSLGVATVCLSALLPGWCSVFWVGVGTGLGYAFCNLPIVFLQSPAIQAWVGVGFAFLGSLALPKTVEWQNDPTPSPVFPAWGALLLFTALVWMDSAAFFIIQHAADLKSGTWGDAMLWRNSVVHLAVAVIAGAWMSRGGSRWVCGTAYVLLAVASLLVNEASSRSVAGWLYPAGVSLYSAALVAWPGWFSGSGGLQKASWRAAWLFAVAGWFGSANGIGMAQSLAHVPPMFVIGAGCVVAGVMIFSNRPNWRAVLAIGFVMATGWVGSIPAMRSDKRDPSPSATRGQQVYLSEGCIHCHSQYVRPGTADGAIWGPEHSVKEVMSGTPVLIGNRRQGPDLTNVGARRSPSWLKAHFIDPRALMHDSLMPSYAHLFKDQRGDDLVQYLHESGVKQMTDVMERAAKWQPTDSSVAADGALLYQNHCSMCHGTTGAGDGPLKAQFTRPATHLVSGPFVWTAPGEALDHRIARVIKFGIAGTDMAGHETLTDSQVNALVIEILKLRKVD